MKLFLVLLASSVYSAPTSSKCCDEKKVGNILYKLFESDKEDATKNFGCKDGCVYTADEDPIDKFCFKDGELPVTCLDDGEHAFHWCYEGDCGPANWGKEFPVCNGKSQSPINIVTGAPTQTEPAKINFGNYDKVRIDDLIISEEHYGDENIVGKRKKRDTGKDGEKDRLEAGTIKNNGHTAQLDVVATLPGDVGVLTGGPLDGAYQILQLHFHWGSDDTKGSEHTLDGKMFPMELHIVHKKVGVEVTEALNMTGGLAVTGFFFEVDAADNAAIEPLVAALANVANPDEKYDMAGSAFKITDLIAGVAPLTAGETYKYSSYSGSLTTPGCMEVVSWINFIDTIKISAKQLKAFRALKDGKNADIVDNFRPVQELYGRTVTFYGA
eukprot:TRINITY_DN355_c0_g1_i4.p1 TRINITY_DN355_c0_g1~~TRINITY_DN355_c0_g1_i4.p1  ORF type:complete len:414 (-),score=164.52 TRINITY_DN355_c0_g1_i4:140-1291(-)